MEKLKKNEIKIATTNAIAGHSPLGAPTARPPLVPIVKVFGYKFYPSYVTTIFTNR